MTKSLKLIAAGLALAQVLCVRAAPAAPVGYLQPGAVPDMVRVLPVPPAPGSKAQAEDDHAFRVTRHLEGTPRWTMAQQDNRGSPDDALHDFACALGVTLDKESAPTLYALLERILSDARAFIDPAKDHYARPRPFLRMKGSICIPRSDFLAKSGSYPSGHSTASWAWGLILSELAPDRSTEILSRARVYSESRVVCGVHYPSDIEAGRLNGSALVAALQSSPEFRSDMEKARAEIAAARAAPDAPRANADVCQVETEAEAKRPW
jgi:acid phosphatase (class A)